MAYSGGSGISADPYQIASLSDINQLKADVVAGLTNDVYYKQTADITLGTFEPIGYKSTTPYYYLFEGNYDGDNKILQNGTISYPGKSYIGIFAHMKNSSALQQNINVKNVKVTGADNTGCITGRLYTTITNCKTDNQCEVTGTGANTGGICGYASYFRIRNCKNSASVVGGIYTGGLVGYISAGDDSGEGMAIKNSHNEGSVVGTNYVGGIVGYGIGGSSYYGRMFYCINTGNISAITYGGGIAGEVHASNLSGIYNCYALNSSITRLSGASVYFGRISSSNSGYIDNNYAIDTMQFISIP